MKKKPASRSAFFNPRFLISLALFACCVLVALLSFALSPGGNARAENSQPSIAQVNPSDPDGGCFLFWSTAAAYPIPVLDNAAVSVGSNLYSFAGVSNGALVANAYKFDGTTWTPIAPVPQPLEFPSAVTDGTDIYI